MYFKQLTPTPCTHVPTRRFTKRFQISWLTRRAAVVYISRRQRQRERHRERHQTKKQQRK